jgi:ketosteroid isomerase-like protein
VSRAARLANLRESRTSFDSLAHAPEEEVIHVYLDGNMAVYTARLTIKGRYGGRAERGEFRALDIWIRRDGRWQKLASQLTPIRK